MSAHALHVYPTLPQACSASPTRILHTGRTTDLTSLLTPWLLVASTARAHGPRSAMRQPHLRSRERAIRRLVYATCCALRRPPGYPRRVIRRAGQHNRDLHPPWAPRALSPVYPRTYTRAHAVQAFWYSQCSSRPARAGPCSSDMAGAAIRKRTWTWVLCYNSAFHSLLPSDCPLPCGPVPSIFSPQ